MKFEVSDSTWPGVLKKLDPVLSALFKDGVLMTSIKLGSVNRISILRTMHLINIYVHVVTLCTLAFSGLYISF